MEVPEMMLNLTLLLSRGKPVGPMSPVQAARMFTPGPNISGFRISGVSEFGPRDENEATTGVARVLNCVPWKVTEAVADLEERM